MLGQARLLDSPVRSIHVTESADLSGLLEGGELILSSGLSLTTSLETTQAFLDGLAAAGAAGVIFSFLSDAPEIKKCLETAAATAQIPVVLLDDRARFVDITETVHRLIYSAARGLSGLDAVSNFLSSAAASHLELRELFSAIADMLDAPLVLEDSLSTVVIHQGLDPEQMRRFIQAPASSKVLGSSVRVVGNENWLVYPVIGHGRKVGQLVSTVGAGNPRASLGMEEVGASFGELLPNGSADLALARQESLSTMVKEVRSGEIRSEKELLLHAAMLGVASVDLFVPIAINFKQRGSAVSASASPDLAAITATLQDTLRGSSFPAFACDSGANGVGILLCLPAAADIEAALSIVHDSIGPVLGTYGNDSSWTMGVGTASPELGITALKGLDEACRVAHSASTMDHSGAPYHRASDLGFRWLMQRLLDVEESHTYVHDQLAPFLDEPEYMDFIETYLQTNGSIAELSRALHLSRPSVYARLRRIEKVQGRELTDADTMTSLHLAVTLYRLGVRG
ncbi:PucR family transcriptional regulator [Paeniglutamicibacter kerguelensis]